MKIRVYFEDTDAIGIVYHANYFKYCDRARNELFFDTGTDMNVGEGALVIKSIDANFIKPAYFGDILEMGGYVSILKKSSVVTKQTIEIEGLKIFEMDTRLVYIENGRPAIMPDSYYNLFLKNMKKIE